MKNFKTYLLCLGLALTTASCSQDDFDSTEATSEKLVEMSFIAGSSQPVTRTVLGSDGATVTWQTNDKIGIGFKGNQPKNYPFTTPTAGSDVHFWGKAPDVNNVSYFMMYPFQQDAKISANSNTQAIYEYNFPKDQNAIAGTFDPKANVSVGIIPQRGKPFIAYNVGGLLRFTIKGTSDVKQVKLLAVGQENLAGTIKSTITFANDGKISAAQNQFSSASPVVSLTAESGSLEVNKAYYIALPEQKLSQGLTLVFIMQDGKAILKKVKQEINIQRAKVYDLGEMTLDETKAKAFILKNQGLIEAVAVKVKGLTRTADGHLDIYAADNLEKILSYKGMLEVNNKDNFTSIDELQYYRNINGLNLQGNKNLAGELNLNKYPQLTNRIILSGSPLVTKVNITGLDKIAELQAHHLNGLKEVVTGNNTKLTELGLYENKSLESVDASNMPSLTTLKTYYSSNIKTINTTNSPNLKEVNATSNSSLTAIIGLDGNRNLEVLNAFRAKIESYDFSLQTKLRVINLTSSAAKEIKGLDKVGASLVELIIPASQITSIDISQNPNLTKLDVNQLKGMTSLDVSHNKKLKFLKTSFTPLTSLDLSNNTDLTELNVTHNKLSSLDISHIPGLTTFRAGSQSNATNHTQVITVKMSTAQKNKFGAIFKIDGSGFDTSGENSTSYVNIIEVQ